MPETAASLRAVRHAYGGVEALRGLDWDVGFGEVTALLGPNGSGKTTLLRILAGVLAPSGGEVAVLGIRGPAGRREGETLRRRLAYVSQSLALDPEMTGRETLALMASLYGVPRSVRAGRVAELAEAFGVTEPLGRRLDTWSGGQRRRLHLAASLVHDPELLLLDEPTAGLDEHGRTFLWEELKRRASEGRAVVIVSHDLPEVERRAHRALLLHRGDVLAAGTPSEIVAEHSREAVTVTLTGLGGVFRRLTGEDPGERDRRRDTGREWKRPAL